MPLIGNALYNLLKLIHLIKHTKDEKSLTRFMGIFKECINGNRMPYDINTVTIFI